MEGGGGGVHGGFRGQVFRGSIIPGVGIRFRPVHKAPVLVCVMCRAG